MTLLSRIIKAVVSDKNRTSVHAPQREAHRFWELVFQNLNLCPGLPALAISRGPLRPRESGANESI